MKKKSRTVEMPETKHIKSTSTQTHVSQSVIHNSFFFVLSELFFGSDSSNETCGLTVCSGASSILCAFIRYKSFKRPNLTEAQPMEQMLIASSNGTVTVMTFESIWIGVTTTRWEKRALKARSMYLRTHSQIRYFARSETSIGK